MPAQRSIANVDLSGAADGTLVSTLPGFARHPDASYATGEIDVRGGALAFVAGSGNALYRFADPKSSVVEINCTFTFRSLNANTIAPCWNLDPAANTFLTFRWRSTALPANSWELARSEAGGATNNMANAAFTPQLDTPYQCRILSTQGRVQVWIDGAKIIDYVHERTLLTRNGLVGVRGTGVAAQSTSEGARLSNLVVNAGWERVELWRNPGASGPASIYGGFRIPAAIRTKNYLVAACEGRFNSVGDNEPMNIVSRRAPLSDLRAWGAEAVVADHGTVNNGRTSNPTFLYDESVGANGRLWIFYDTYPQGVYPSSGISAGLTGNTASAKCRVSDNEGLSWGPEIDLTAAVKKPIESALYFGPGKGIKIASGPHAGRYVVPLAGKIPSQSFENRGRAILSDDGGVTWQVGGDFTASPIRSDENQIVELSDGRLCVSIRDSPSAEKKLVYSDDGGTTWGTPVPVPALDDDAVHHGFYGFGPAHPAVVLTQPGHPTERADPRIMVSLDDTATWSDPTLPAEYLPGGKQIDTQGAGYSAIEEHDGTLVVLFEQWCKINGNGYETINAFLVPLEDVGIDLSEAPPDPLAAGTLSNPTAITSSSATLSWTAAAGGVGPATAQLQRRLATGPGAWTDVSGATASPATDAGLASSTAYDWRVAYSDGNETAYSNTVSGTTLAPPPDPLAAGTLSGPTGVTSSSATLSWTAATGGTGTVAAQLQRRTTAGPGIWAVVSGATASPFTNTGLAAETGYDWRVAYSDDLETVYSNTVSGTTAADPADPADPPTITPGALSVASIASRSVTVAWVAPTSDPPGATIVTQLEARPAAGEWADVPAATASPATVAGLEPGTAYQFRVRCEIG